MARDYVAAAPPPPARTELSISRERVCVSIVLLSPRKKLDRPFYIVYVYALNEIGAD